MRPLDRIKVLGICLLKRGKAVMIRIDPFATVCRAVVKEKSLDYEELTGEITPDFAGELRPAYGTTSFSFAMPLFSDRVNFVDKADVLNKTQAKI
jgi:hypothetical protein